MQIESIPLAQAFDRLYADVRGIARLHLSRERQDHTWTPTDLAHEAWVRLPAYALDVPPNHFFGAVTRVMRQALIDHARKRNAAKRDAVIFPLDEGPGCLAPQAPANTLLALDEALTEFAKLDPRRARVVELRFFVGLSLDETAEIMGYSSRTVKRDWTIARAWLRRQVNLR